MKYLKKKLLIRLGLILGSTIIILWLLPHDDHQSYSYEQNQPWRYPLLTAEFDMPVLRDSASARVMRDSIDASFVPFVKRDNSVQTSGITRFRNSVAGELTPAESGELASILAEVYARGVVSSDLYERINNRTGGKLRVESSENGASTLATIDGSEMLSPAKAFEYIDSVFNSRHKSRNSTTNRLADTKGAMALNAVLSPNVVPDTAVNVKFLEQELLTVNGALGVIKKGQRIVDRGEIVTPQIFTNLNTYLDMLDTNSNTEHESTYFMVGQALYLLICFTGLFVFLSIYRPIFYESDKKIAFLVTFITLFVIFSVLMFEYFANGPYFVPYAMVPVVILVFFDSRTAIFSLVVTVMICALVSVYPFQFIFLELAAGLTAAFSINILSQRSQLLRTALFTFLAYCTAYTAIRLLSDGNLAHFEWRTIGAFAINAVVLSFAYILVLVVEKIYGFTSTVTLVELSDINNPLLRRLAQEAPGTFQHSMQVSTLAAEAARAIGANTQLVRTGALYHDVGKLESPIFFTENQHGVNPHQGLDPETSARKIISHVSAGVSIAQHAKIPTFIRSFITEHHGRSLTRYFYNTAVNANPDKTIDKANFMYPGPNPQSKETTVLMMADAVEAASRSLKDYSPASINSLVDKIIDAQQSDGLYSESPISFQDVEVVKDTFKKRLATIYHSRVSYPEQNRPAETPKQEPAENAGENAAEEIPE